VFIQANGFTIGATVTKPTGVTGRAPAVILAAGPSSPGRERMTAGVPVFARLAGMLADDGYLVVRFDARGSGQSGGRLENADLGFYRDDLLAVVQWLRRQPYADSNRLAVVGYADSAPIAMMAAEREDRIKGVVLLAAHGRSGREVVLEQQRRVLAQLQIPDAERTRRVALQNAINDAVITGKGWESISTDVRRDADTPWFRSWLLFDPAVSLQKMKQPVLIVRAGLDAEIGAADADRLEALARDSERRSAPLTQKVVIESANQAFAIPNAGGPASTASADVISRELGRAIADWFRRVAPAR
jgi:dienelactone hydrolase